MDQTKYQPLYLKHRPQALSDLVGQKSVVKTLTNAIENKRIAHAYLFTGPRGTGKTSSARILAKSINCEHGPTVAPCLTCASCVSIKESSCPSVFEIDAASNNSVDDARTLIERAPLVAQGGRSKLYIIDECHMLTKEAFNALLKTIEEPPPNVIFVLATTEEHKVPPTILSRCQRLMFRLVNHDELAEHLANVAEKEGIEIEKDALELITRRSGGGLRDALGLLDQASLLARPGEPVSQKDLLVLLGALDEDVLLTLSKGILDRDGRAVLDAISGLVMQGREPTLIAQEMAKHFLNLAKASYVQEEAASKVEDSSRFILGSATYLAGLKEQAGLFERVELTQMVEELDKLEQALKRSTQPSMSLEIALLSLCHRHDIKSVKDLESRLSQLEQMISEGDISRGAPKRLDHVPPPVKAPPVSQPQARPAVPAQPAPAPVPAQPAPVPAPPAPVPSAPTAPEPVPMQSVPAAEPQPAPMPQATFNANDMMGDDDDIEERIDDENADDDYEAPPLPQPAVEQQAPTAPSEEAPAQAPAPPPGDSASASDLEELWSNLLDCLHKRSIPAYSLVSMHAFPVRFESNQLTIGVQKEFFQKSIENKTNNIIQAYKDLYNQEIKVLVKVMTEGGQPKAEPPKRREAHEAAPQQPTPNYSQQAKPVETANAQTSAAPVVQSRMEETNAPVSQSEFRSAASSMERETRVHSVAIVEALPPEPETNSQTLDNPTDETLDPGKLAEAYKIFEGPGSRLIG